MKTRRIALLQPLLASVVELPAERYEVVRMWEPADGGEAAGAEALVVAGEFPLTEEVTARLPALRLVASFSVGYDGVDPAWAERAGVAVTHARDVNAEDVADFAIGLILASRRGIVAGDDRLRGGGWAPGRRTVTRSLKGARLGIVGLGAIGEAVARRAEALRMQVAWWGPKPKPARWPRADSLERLAADSDVLVLAARAHAGNVGLVSAEVIAALGPEGLLVNVARGQLVDEDALIAALRDGALGGAALDVFAEEPTPAARWADVPNCVLTPHLAGVTDAAVAEMRSQLVENLDAFFEGRRPPGLVA